MLQHTKEIVIPTFNHAFPDIEALFAFDNMSNNSLFASDALLELRIYLNHGEKQPIMHYGWNYSRHILQSITFANNYHNFELKG